MNLLCGENHLGIPENRWISLHTAKPCSDPAMRQMLMVDQASVLMSPLHPPLSAMEDP